MDSLWWRCSECSSWKSVRKGSFFECSHLTLAQWLIIFFHWTTNTPSKRIQELVEVSKKTVINALARIREISSCKVDSENIQLGGTGRIVEIDESKFGVRQKYHHGRASHGPWVFGMIERHSKRVLLFRIPNRKRETLLPIIEQHILPGTTIYSDEFTPYHILNDCGLNHVTVNHSHNFVDPDTGAHTNIIEGTWGQVKRKMKRMNGTLNDKLRSYLDEFMCKRLYGADAMMNILSHVSDVFPL